MHGVYMNGEQHWVQIDVVQVARDAHALLMGLLTHFEATASDTNQENLSNTVVEIVNQVGIESHWISLMAWKCSGRYGGAKNRF